MTLPSRAMFAVIALAAAAAAQGDVYSYVDARGVVHYSNVPTDIRYQFLMAGPNETTQSGAAFDALTLARAGRYDPIIESAALATAVEADLLRAVIAVESGFDPNAKSNRGAVGLMQLMPATAQRFGVSDRSDPRQNVDAGARYLKALMDRYENDLELVLAAYNAGESAVDRCGGCIPRYKETQAYVPRVIRVYQTLLGQAEKT